MVNQNNVDTHQCKRSFIWCCICANDERAVSRPLLKIIIIMLRTMMVLWQWLLRGQIWKAGIHVANKKNNIGHYVDPNIDSCISSNIGHNSDPDIGPYIGPDIHTYIGPNICTYIGPDIHTYIDTNNGRYIGPNIGLNIGTNIGPYISSNDHLSNILPRHSPIILVSSLHQVGCRTTLPNEESSISIRNSYFSRFILPFPSESHTFHVLIFQRISHFQYFTGSFPLLLLFLQWILWK